MAGTTGVYVLLHSMLLVFHVSIEIAGFRAAGVSPPSPCLLTIISFRELSWMNNFLLSFRARCGREELAALCIISVTIFISSSTSSIHVKGRDREGAI